MITKPTTRGCARALCPAWAETQGQFSSGICIYKFRNPMWSGLWRGPWLWTCDGDVTTPPWYHPQAQSGS